MARTPAEIQKAYRERKKEKLEESRDESLEFVRSPVSDYLGDTTFGFEGSLDAFGISLHTKEWLDPQQTFETWGDGEKRMTALERLEGIAGGFHDAAQELYAFINGYKIAEARNRREELLDVTYETSEAQRAALEKVTRIDAVIKSLSRERRLMLPVIATNVA
jgi:hypothetical protein